MEMAMHCDREQSARPARFAERCTRAVAAIGSFIAARFFRSTHAGEKSALHIEEKLSLGPKKMVYLVSCREKEFLIAAGADTIVSILEVSATEPARRAACPKASLTSMQKRERLP